MKNYINALKKYAVFGGRATRTEYWMFCLFSSLIWLTLAFIDAFRGIALSKLSALSLIYFLGTLIPFASVSVRRLHDISFRGLWFLLWFLGLGLFLLPIFSLIDSTPGENKYGPDPKGRPKKYDDTEKRYLNPLVNPPF